MVSSQSASGPPSSRPSATTMHARRLEAAAAASRPECRRTACPPFPRSAPTSRAARPPAAALSPSSRETNVGPQPDDAVESERDHGAGREDVHQGGRVQHGAARAHDVVERAARCRRWPPRSAWSPGVRRTQRRMVSASPRPDRPAEHGQIHLRVGAVGPVEPDTPATPPTPTPASSGQRCRNSGIAPISKSRRNERTVSRAGARVGVAEPGDEHGEDEPRHADRHERDAPAVRRPRAARPARARSRRRARCPEERIPIATARPRPGK